MRLIFLSSSFSSFRFSSTLISPAQSACILSLILTIRPGSEKRILNIFHWDKRQANNNNNNNNLYSGQFSAKFLCFWCRIFDASSSSSSFFFRLNLLPKVSVSLDILHQLLSILEIKSVYLELTVTATAIATATATCGFFLLCLASHAVSLKLRQVNLPKRFIPSSWDCRKMHFSSSQLQFEMQNFSCCIFGESVGLAASPEGTWTDQRNPPRKLRCVWQTGRAKHRCFKFRKNLCQPSVRLLLLHLLPHTNATSWTCLKMVTAKYH